MDDNLPKDIDAMIEAALSSEPMLRAPISLCRRVEERIRITNLREQERVRFRYSMTTLAVAFLASLAVAGMVVSFTNLDVLYNHGVPGGKGQYDYYATSMLLSCMGYSGSYSLVLSVLGAAGALILGLIPLSKRMRTH